MLRHSAPGLGIPLIPGLRPGALPLGDAAGDRPHRGTAGRAGMEPGTNAIANA